MLSQRQARGVLSQYIINPEFSRAAETPPQARLYPSPRIVGSVKACLCTVDRQPGVDGPGSCDLDKGRRACVPGRDGSVQIGEDEVRKTN